MRWSFAGPWRNWQRTCFASKGLRVRVPLAPPLVRAVLPLLCCCTFEAVQHKVQQFNPLLSTFRGDDIGRPLPEERLRKPPSTCVNVTASHCDGLIGSTLAGAEAGTRP